MSADISSRLLLPSLTSIISLFALCQPSPRSRRRTTPSLSSSPALPLPLPPNCDITSLQPKAVSEAEDLELAALMAKVERENAEVSGDEDGSDEEEQ